MRRSRGVASKSFAFIMALECWTLIWALLLASSMPYYACHGLAPPGWMSFRGRQSQSQSLPTKETTAEASSSKSGRSSNSMTRSIRIRSTQATDLPEIATILSTAAINPESGRWNWKTSMDRLWAKADIEALLRPRLDAIQEGRKTLARVLRPVDDSLEDQDQTRLEILWGNDQFRRSVLKASRETGESNVWLKHNFAMAPKDTSWLYHLQITAEDAATGKVIGFVEVAMLSNPDDSRRKPQRENESSENDKDSDADSNNSNQDDDDDDICSLIYYSPAITNLAVSEDWRRRGIASRLLQTAARFARQKWEAQEFGLYVEQTNSAAIALYQRNGYTVKKSCAGGEQLGDMFYMACPIENTALSKATTDSTRVAERDYASRD
jgi:ribosomal protein S18 acetylase RimI-like enzyme